LSRRITRRHSEGYDIRLTHEDLIRVTFHRENDPVTEFSVQYLAQIQGEWKPIIRFDTAHGRAHMDVSHPRGIQDTRELPIQDYSDALTWAIQNVETRWEFYRQRYEEELK